VCGPGAAIPLAVPSLFPCRVWRHIATGTYLDKARRINISLDIAKRSLDTVRIELKKVPTKPAPEHEKALQELPKPKK
jgi:hypothetical protein